MIIYLIALTVRHRIDGLEKISEFSARIVGVRHRIDGLEMQNKASNKQLQVRHRIDGLEIVPP